MRHYLTNERGNILIITYFVVSLMLLFGSTYLARSMSEIVASERFAEGSRAFWAAETGLAQALYLVGAGQNPTIASSSFENGAVYSASTSADSLSVTATGASSTQVQKMVSVLLKRTGIFSNTLSAGGNIDFSGTTSIPPAAFSSDGQSQYAGAIVDQQAGQTIASATAVDAKYAQFRVYDRDSNHLYTDAAQKTDFRSFCDYLVSVTPNSLAAPDSNGNLCLIYPNSSYYTKDLVYIKNASLVAVLVDASGTYGSAHTTMNTTLVTDSPVVLLQNGTAPVTSWLNIVTFSDLTLANVFGGSYNGFYVARNNINIVNGFAGKKIIVATPGGGSSQIQFVAQDTTTLHGSLIAGNAISYSDTFPATIPFSFTGTGSNSPNLYHGSFTVNYNADLQDETKQPLLNKICLEGLEGYFWRLKESSWNEGPAN